MKAKRFFAAASAAAIAVSAFSAAVCAYDIDKDLKTGWSISATVPAEEFEGATTDSVFTITVTPDASLADTPGHEYWSIKPMINDTGWPFIDTLVGPVLSEGKDAYTLTSDTTEVKFTIPAEELEHLQIAGMAIIGHGITLGSFSFSNDETLPAPQAEEPQAADPQLAQTTESSVDSSTASSGGNPSTGVSDIFAFGSVTLLSAAAMIAASKRK